MKNQNLLNNFFVNFTEFMNIYAILKKGMLKISYSLSLHF
jgi:hypothetical protein